METWRPGANLVLNVESVELERVWRSEKVADIDAHSLGVECWREMVHTSWSRLEHCAA